MPRASAIEERRHLLIQKHQAMIDEKCRKTGFGCKMNFLQLFVLYQKQQRNGKGLSYKYCPFEKNEQELRKLQRNPIIFMYGSNKMMWLCVPYTVLKCIWQWRDIAFNVLREYVFLYNRPLFSKQCKKLLCSIKSPSKKEMSCKEPFAKNKKHGKMLFDTVFIKSYIDSIVVLVIKNFHKNHTLTNRQPLKELSVIKMLKCHKVSFLLVNPIKAPGYAGGIRELSLQAKNLLCYHNLESAKTQENIGGFLYESFITYKLGM